VDESTIFIAKKSKPVPKGISHSFGSPAFSMVMGETRDFARTPHDVVAVSGTLNASDQRSGISQNHLQCQRSENRRQPDHLYSKRTGSVAHIETPSLDNSSEGVGTFMRRSVSTGLL
jgi:hypothetical protein